MTILGRGDLVPRRRPRRWGRRVLGVVLVLAVLGGGGYVAYGQLSGPATPAADQAGPVCHTPAAVVAPARPSAVRMRVVNTTTKSGLAASVARGLRGRGFHVITVGNASPTVKGAVVRYPRSGGETAHAAARAVQVTLRGSRLTAVPGKASIELEIGKGFPGLAPSSTLAARRQAAERAASPRPVCSSAAS